MKEVLKSSVVYPDHSSPIDDRSAAHVPCRLQEWMGPRAGPSAAGHCKPEAAEGEHHWAQKSKDHRGHLLQPLLEAREVAPQPYDQHASRP